jgi:hypothetical protein
MFAWGLAGVVMETMWGPLGAREVTRAAGYGDRSLPSPDDGRSRRWRERLTYNYAETTSR